MSWDVFIMSAAGVPSNDVSTWPNELELGTIGDADEVRTMISSAWPEAKWSNPAWGFMDAQGIAAEINFQLDGTVEAIMLHVLSSDDPVPPILRLCAALDCVALDISTGLLLDADRPDDAGYVAWRNYRDRVVNPDERGGDPDAR